MFGLAGQSLAGMGYTATYRFDDSLGSRTTIAPYLDSVIGGAYNGDTSPSLGAVLTINALSFHFNGSNLGLQSNYPLGGQISSYASDLATLGAFDASFIGNSLTATGVPVPMNTPYVGSGIPAIGGFTNNFQIAYGPAGTITRFASGTLAPVSVVVTVTAVPEPATWAMAVVGFGVLGGALRGKSRRKMIDAQRMPGC